MTKKPTLAAVALIALAAGAGVAEERAPWSYAGANGPAHWGDKAVDCRDGKQQSPIEIKTKGAGAAAPSTELPKIVFQWKKSTGHLLDNGHTIQVNFEGGNNLQLGEETFELTQFHFHAPSEHTIDGRAAALELQFVHKNADGKLTVISLLVDREGAGNAALQPVFNHLEKPGDVELELPALLPAAHGYFAYDGSLTSPPCTEAVRWLVLQEHVKASSAQVRRFTKLFAHNARPVQPLNGRSVQLQAE